MVFDLNDFVSSLPPMSMLSTIAFSIVVAATVLYMLSRVREFLLIMAIALVYGCVPLLPVLIKHLA